MIGDEISHAVFEAKILKATLQCLLSTNNINVIQICLLLCFFGVNMSLHLCDAN